MKKRLCHLERIGAHVRADIFLVTQLVQIVVHLGEDIEFLVRIASELGQRDGVVRFAASFLGAVVNQDGVSLVPATALVRETSPDDGVVPKGGQALVALDARVVVGGREVELVPAPDGHDLAQVVGGQQGGDHALDVLGARRGPDDDPKGADAVLHKLGGVAPGEEPGGLFAVGAVQDGAVEVDDDEEGARVGAAPGQERGAHEVGGRGVGDAARGPARGAGRGPAGLFAARARAAGGGCWVARPFVLVLVVRVVRGLVMGWQHRGGGVYWLLLLLLLLVHVHEKGRRDAGEKEVVEVGRLTRLVEGLFWHAEAWVHARRLLLCG